MSLAAPMLLLLEAFLHVSLATKKTDWSECFQVNGADYRGFQNQTSVPDGKPCLYWNQTHQHAYNTERFPNGQWGLGNHNYCRNPDGDVQPWCYVSESEEGIYWKYCDIPTCQMPGYRGCFLDSGNPPALSGSSGTSTKLTVQVCIRFCRRRGYSVAGVEAGYACFCGDESDLVRNERVSAVECDQVCFGKSSELCGGDGRIGVYDVSVGSCSGNLSSASGVLFSPDFPDDYPSDSNCSWLIAPGGGAGAVEVRLELYEVRDPRDVLAIWDPRTGRLLSRFQGAVGPGQQGRTEIFFGDSILVTFQSDGIVQGQGFALAYKGLEANATEEGASTGPPTHLNATSPTAVPSNGAIGSSAAWLLCAACLASAALASALIFCLHKRTCLFVKKKPAGGVLLIGSGSGVHCGGGQGWSVTYRHTRVIVCGQSKEDGLCGTGSSSEEDTGCLCDPTSVALTPQPSLLLYGSRQSVSTQSSLRSLISSI
ncbi:kremen protein 2-like isoform X1 [Polypterus senegalus]|uniref:kremen protein 2-like isoform X1 n=1 Tax=Polypterus senegalus TaxID=55291 RepID=UPI0019657C29|nr:kremen protein 2-like isoform X1 [Polypterus senegalus]